MATSERLDFSQPLNDLGIIGQDQRKKLIPKNDYKETNQYSATNKDAISDGFINSKNTKNDSKISLDSKNETKSSCTIEEQHHHLLTCLEKTTVLLN